MRPWHSSLLAEEHDLSTFDCGTPALNAWLSLQAWRAQVQGTARTYVWTAPDDNWVVAYYSIAPHQVTRGEVSGGMAGGVSVIPAYLLARLALDHTVRGRGLGSELLHDALERIVSAADIGGGRLVAVDAIDDNASRFYAHHGFRPVRDNPLRLVMKISTIRKAILS